MNNIKILDCTLRDGGYINNWNFESSNIKTIINNLTKSGMDYIECGFLEDFETYDINCSLFNSVDQIEQFIPENRGNTEFVAMTRFGELDINNLKIYDGRSISGIRITFHLEEMLDALEFCEQVKRKGYKVFVQPVGTTSYSDEELLSLIHMVNELNPYSFYIVDTLGTMTKNDVHRMYYLIDHNLNPEIKIGFHSHNNLQLSFSNSQELVSLHAKRTIFIDSSVYGMGRGAGNLNTELIAEYINSNLGEVYDISYLLEIIDECISSIRNQYSWGYSVPYYLAAIHNCHPNYATFLINKKTLQVNLIAKILTSIPIENRELYDNKLVEQLYLDFQAHWINDNEDIEKLKKIIKDKKILVLAPGKSVVEYKDKIDGFIEAEKPVIISVQFLPNGIDSDFVFFSNRKRIGTLENELSDPNKQYKVIVTSNIGLKEFKNQFRINYSSLLNSFDRVKDNSTLMLLNLLDQINLKEVTFAGFDGYHKGSSGNYISGSMETYLDEEILLNINEEIRQFLNIFSEKVKVRSITPTLYIDNDWV
ncbi:aldolase catalytic domain-containing protein [Paenibacillus polymyxa]